MEWLGLLLKTKRPNLINSPRSLTLNQICKSLSHVAEGKPSGILKAFP